MNSVKAVGLKKYYSTPNYEVRALDGVSFNVDEGEFLAIVGTSGSGKTTLLNLLGGLDIPDEGGVWIRENSLRDMNSEERTIFRRRNIGFIFQQYNLIPMISVYENIVLPLRLDGAEIDEVLLDELVKILKLQEKLEQLPETLSGGQQQRATIGRAIANHPKVLIADEPTGNLDPDKSAEIMELLEKINEVEKTTVVMVTHDSTIVDRFKKRTICLEEGYVVADIMKGGYLKHD